jgi:hypothetical protein
VVVTIDFSPPHISPANPSRRRSKPLPPLEAPARSRRRRRSKPPLEAAVATRSRRLLPLRLWLRERLPRREQAPAEEEEPDQEEKPPALTTSPPRRPSFVRAYHCSPSPSPSLLFQLCTTAKLGRQTVTSCKEYVVSSFVPTKHIHSSLGGCAGSARRVTFLGSLFFVCIYILISGSNVGLNVKLSSLFYIT